MSGEALVLGLVFALSFAARPGRGQSFLLRGGSRPVRFVLQDGRLTLDLARRAQIDLFEGTAARPHRLRRGDVQVVSRHDATPQIFLSGAGQTVVAAGSSWSSGSPIPEVDGGAIFGLTLGSWPPRISSASSEKSLIKAMEQLGLQYRSVDVADSTASATLVIPSAADTLFLQFEARDPEETGEMMIQSAVTQTASGVRITNRVVAFDSAVHPGIFIRGHGRLVLHAGCRLEVSQERGYDRPESGDAHVRILAGHAYFEPESVNKSGAVGQPASNSSSSIRGPGGQAVKSATVTLVGLPDSGTDRLERELVRTFRLKGGQPGFTLLTILPATPTELLSIVPIQVEQGGGGSRMRLGIGSNQADSAGAGTESRLTILPAPEGEVPTRVEAFPSEPSTPAGAAGSRKGEGVGYCFSYSRPDPWVALELHSKRMKPGDSRPTGFFSSVSSPMRMLGRISFFTALLAIFAYGLSRLRRFSAATFLVCKSCNQAMSRRRLGVLEVSQRPGLLDALAKVSSLADKGGAASYFSAVRAQGVTAVDPESTGLSRVLIQSDWCLRCEQGYLRTLLLRRGKVIDEREVPYQGKYSSDILQEVFDRLESDGVVK